MPQARRLHLEQAIKKLTHDNARPGTSTIAARSAPRVPGRPGAVRGGSHPAAAADGRRTCRAAHADWCRKAEGIKATLVNGAVAFADGEATGEYQGEVLKGRLAS